MTLQKRFLVADKTPRGKYEELWGEGNTPADCKI